MSRHTPRHAAPRRRGWSWAIGAGITGLLLGILANALAVFIIGGGQ